MNKKKILYIATEPSVGMLPFAITIINTIAYTKEYQIQVIVVNTKKSSFYNKLSPDINVTYIQENEFLIKKIIDKFWLSNVIKTINNIKTTFNPDIIHLLTADFRLGLYIRLNKDDRYCYTVHDLHPHERNKKGIIHNMINKIMLWGCKLNRENINNLTTSSYNQFLELKHKYPNKNIQYTHFPTLITDSIIEGGKKVKELIEINEYILFFGTVDAYKGVDLLIKAYLNSQLLQKYKLVIAGKGNCQLPDSKNIIRINRFIDDEELKDLFNKAKIVVYPYISATMSGVLSIAMYFKRNMLLSNIPFFKEFQSEESIVYFENQNITDLKNKLEINVNKLHNNDNQYNLFFSKETLINDYNKLYNSITSKHKHNL